MYSMIRLPSKLSKISIQHKPILCWWLCILEEIPNHQHKTKLLLQSPGGVVMTDRCVVCKKSTPNQNSGFAGLANPTTSWLKFVAYDIPYSCEKCIIYVFILSREAGCGQLNIVIPPHPNRIYWKSSACPIGQNAKTKFSSTLFDFFGGAREIRKLKKKILFWRCRRRAAARRHCAVSIFHEFLLKWVRAKVSISPQRG